MKKDTLRSILVAVGTLAAAFFGLGEEIINQATDLVMTIVFSGISLYNVIVSAIRPADDDTPKFMTDGKD